MCPRASMQSRPVSKCSATLMCECRHSHGAAQLATVLVGVISHCAALATAAKMSSVPVMGVVTRGEVDRGWCVCVFVTVMASHQAASGWLGC